MSVERVRRGVHRGPAPRESQRGPRRMVSDSVQRLIVAVVIGLVCPVVAASAAVHLYGPAPEVGADSWRTFAACSFWVRSRLISLC